MSAPFAISSSAIFFWLACAAAWSGVVPQCSFAFSALTSAPASSSTATTDSCPFQQAQCKGVDPSLSLTDIREESILTSSLTLPASPDLAAFSISLARFGAFGVDLAKVQPLGLIRLAVAVQLQSRFL